MNQMPRESGKRFSIVAAICIAGAACVAFSSSASALPQGGATRDPGARATASEQHATSGPDLPITPSRCYRLDELRGPPAGARSVRDFGATPDDESDDTVAIQRALDALSPNEWLVFPAGRYLHSARLRVTVPGVKLWGRGAQLHASNPADMAVMLMADGASIYGFTLTAFTGKRGNKPYEARIAIHPRAADTPMLRGNEVRANRIVADAARDPRAANSATTTGVFVYRARDFLVAENYVERSLADGIHITSGSAFGRVVGNTVRETGDDMIALVSYLGRREESTAQIAGDLAARVERALVHDIVIEGNDLAGQYWGRGIALVGARAVTVRGNRISDTTTAAAIYIAREAGYKTAGVQDVLVAGNRIERVQTTAPRYMAASVPPGRRKTGHSAILLVAQIAEDEARHPELVQQLQIRGVHIENNRIEDTAGDAIRVSSRGGWAGLLRGTDGSSIDEPVSDVTIVGNRIARAGGRPLVLDGAGDAARLSCRGNSYGGAAAGVAGCSAVRDLDRAFAVRGADLACLRAPPSNGGPAGRALPAR